MKRLMRSIAWAVALVLLLTHSPWADDQSGNGGPPPPPWIDDKVKPPEVKDRDDKKDFPDVICTTVRKDGKTEHKAFYYDEGGVIFEVRYVAGVSWVVKVPDREGLQAPTKIIYDLQKRTRTVEEPGKDPATTTWKDAPTPTAHKTTPGRELTIARTPVVPAQPTPTTKTTPRTPTTVERPPTTSTQETPPTIRITFIVKAKVTHGGPGDDATVHFDDPPPITPEKFVAGDQGKTAPVDYPWEDPDRKGPTFSQLDPPPPHDGEPPDKTYSFAHTSITTLFGWNMFINVGWGWAHATIPSGVVSECTNEEDDAAALEKLAKDAKTGGPEYWRRVAASKRAEASMASGLRPQIVKRLEQQAAEAEETAAKLEERGVEDIPDPKKVPDKEKRAQIEKRRQAAIEKIKADAEEARTK